jgi:hypothetical protein
MIEMPTIKMPRSVGLALLVAIIALAAATTVQASEEPHWVRNGGVIPERKRVPVIGWGTIEFGSLMYGTFTCKNVVTGYVENLEGGTHAVGATQLFITYQCSSAQCPAEARAEAFKLPWHMEVVERFREVFTLASERIDVVIGCWTGGVTGPGNVNTAERGEIAAGALLTYEGEWTQGVKNGTTAGRPTHLEGAVGFGPGQMREPRTTLLGYKEQELITVGS